MSPFVHRSRRIRSDDDRGFGLVEPLVSTLLILIALAGTASVLGVINKGLLLTQQQVVMQASIDDNIRQIKTLARQYTCCSGSCTTMKPTQFGVVGGVTQPCATNNPLDNRYYYPQVTISNEQTAVDTLCQTDSTNNTKFMSPFKTSIDALSQPTNATRATVIDNSNPHVLKVTFTDNINNNRVVRVENIIPRMAFFCV
jgi:type II secretory pathway pseudopilin PulG